MAFHRVGLKDNSLRYVSQMRVTVGSEEEPDQLVDSVSATCQGIVCGRAPFDIHKISVR